MHMKRSYKFSIVTAIYNTAEYLEEMIESVIKQDIGFEDNVQLILVDDGSSDNSLSICKEYEKKYPDNINVICLNHSGVSAARNEGIKLVEGKYVNFLDSDDKLEINALSEVEKFFKEYEEVDLVAIPLYFFDNDIGEHILNTKFEKTRVIDIKGEYRSIQLSSSSTFIKTDVMKLYKFNAKLKYAEDAQLITDIILRKGKYGVVKETKYYYRRRMDNSSATQSNQKPEWYIDYIREFSYEMMKKIKSTNKEYHNYVQYLVLYDLQWRINQLKFVEGILNKSECIEFYSTLLYVIKHSNSRILMEQKNITLHRKITIILLKINKFKIFNNVILNFLTKI